MIRSILVAALWAGGVMLGGCAAEPLTLDLVSIGARGDRAYHLEPDGRLKLTIGPGLSRGESRDAYETQLAGAAMARLKSVIFASGFLVEEPPFKTTLTRGQAIRLEITLGWWHNRIDTLGQPVASIGKIIAELNRNLPEEHQLKYTPGKVVPEEDTLKPYGGW